MIPTESLTTNITSKQMLENGSHAAIKKTAKDFESVFMSQMLKPMWEGVDTDPMFGGGAGEDAFRDMLVQEYGKVMASVDDFGLSDAVVSEMVRIQSQMSF